MPPHAGTARFISDLHLRPSGRDLTRVRRLPRRHGAANAEVLFILGDLFEYWAGDDDLTIPSTNTSAICCAARRHGSAHLSSSPATATSCSAMLFARGDRPANCCPRLADRRWRHGDSADARRHGVHRRPALPGIPPHGARPEVASRPSSRPAGRAPRRSRKPAPRSEAAMQGKTAEHHGCQSGAVRGH
jgi:hypothetical protein